jgi:hypothetical protein
MFNMQVVQASSGGALLAASSKLTNQASSLTFVSLARSIVVNGGQPILLTYGTYSLPIEVKPSSGTQFETNMELTLSAAGLTFVPAVLEVGVGQSVVTFRVGGDVNLLLTTLSYNITKVEQSGTSLYTVPSDLLIKVVDTSVPIALPSTLTVPRGGCSVPVRLELPVLPFSGVAVNYQYNSTLYNESLFYINQVTSGFNLDFGPSTKYQLMSFCATTSMAASTLSIGLVLSGIQQQSYSLPTTSMTVSIVNQASSSPSLGLAAGSSQRQSVPLTATTNQEGTLYYQFFITGTAGVYDLIDIELKTKSETVVVEGGGGSMLPTVFSTLRDNRVGVLAVAAGTNSLTLTKLHPDTTYTVCAYLLTVLQQATNATCLNVTTAAWGPFQKALLNFNKDITRAEMNRLLCFFTKAASTQAQFLVNSRGESCSFSSFPASLHYSYSGVTADYSHRRTILYQVPDPAQGVDPAVSAFRALFDPSSLAIKPGTLSDALTLSSIAFIDTGLLKDALPHSASQQASIPNMTFSRSEPKLTLETTATATFSNFTGTKPGAYYLAFSREKYIIEGENTTLFVRLNPLPSAQQVLQCSDYYNLTVACGRVIITEAEVVTLAIPALEKNSLYRVFALYAGEYPLFPASNLSVANFTIATVHATLLLALLWTALLV